MKSSAPRPPAAAEWILKQVFSDQEKYSHLGDFREAYEDVRKRRGSAAARAWYWTQTLKSLPAFISHRLSWSLSMLRNYFLIAFRNILKNKSFSLINLAGLALGLAGVVLIMAFVRFELSFDRFHEKAGRIYRVNTGLRDNPESPVSFLDGSADPLAAALAADIPEVARATRMVTFFGKNIILQSENSAFLETGLFADAEFLNVFSFPLLRGDRQTALSGAGSIVLTETTVRKLFGSSDPLGKPISFRRGETVFDLSVTGVAKDIPANSHLRFDFLASLETLRRDKAQAYMFNAWGILNFVTYAELRAGADKAAVEAKFPEFLKKFAPKEFRPELALQPLKDIHLRSQIEGQLATNNQIQVVRLFSAIALVLLLIAGANYVNLTTSRSAVRAREIGIRKTAGAHRHQLFQQFLGESLALTVGASILALAFVRLAWPRFQRLVGIDLDFGMVWNPESLALFAGIALAVAVLAGFYPALILSGLHPVRALREFGRSGRQGALLRKTLVVGQFAASIVLLAGTIVISRQMHFIQSRNLGYDREQVITIPVREAETQKAAETIRADYLRNPNVLGVTVSNAVPAKIDNYFGGIQTQTDEGATIKTNFGVGYIDECFLDFYKIGLVEGRNIGPGEKTAALVNESLVEALGWKKPLGKILDIWGRTKLTVVGVVRDFHFASLYAKITPLALFPQIYGPGDVIAVRVRPGGDIAGILAGLRAGFENRTKGQPFEYAFLDDTFDALYRKEARMGEFFEVFALLAVFVACLGLSGLTAFTVERRTKEIGIRKVLGASAARLTVLLNRQFVLLVLLANAAALPLAYFALNGWLRNFAYRISLTIWTLAAASLVTLAVAMATISLQTTKAAGRNPVETLHSE
jgi:putative ABC transport system permease protein